MKFPEHKKLDLAEICSNTYKFWEKNDIFKKSLKVKRGGKRFVFYEGPPSANGMPGIHHIMARLIKDIFCRYKTLTGHIVDRKAGWDTHGLPVELSVEKSLNIKKDDIGSKISIEEYNEECKKTVMKYTSSWNNLTNKMGYWIDVDSPYITYTNKYIESVWYLLKRLYKKDLIYQGYTIQPYSPAAGTGLSSHEINQPGCYKKVKDLSVVALFKVIKHDLSIEHKKELFFMAWTTTPWTLFSNTGLAVNRSVSYSLIETINPYNKNSIYVICASDCIEKWFDPALVCENIELFNKDNIKPRKTPYKILGKLSGKRLVGFKYEQLLPYINSFERNESAFRVVDADFVTTKDGTGIVHLAPTFGSDDFMVAKKHNLPLMLTKAENKKDAPLVDLNGRLCAGLGEFSGRFVKPSYSENPNEESVDVDIVVKLKKEGLAFVSEKYEHSYPHCWRTDKPILYYPLNSWFIRSTEYRELMIKKNQEINWKPKSTGEGRFENWLENINDWNLSRSRFWGIPLPIWRSQNKEDVLCVGSIKELKELCEDSVAAGFMKKNPLSMWDESDMSEENYSLFDLHKNFVDNIVLVSKNGQPLFREAEVIDVWFDSGAMPYAQWHYPFENKNKIDGGDFFPADFIAEGVDQTRGWFFTLHAIAVMCFGSVAYKNVISNGLVLDKVGQKMSKRLGNTINPFNVIEKHGADAVRWYMISNSQPWENLKFSVEGIIEVKQKFFSTIYNIYSFFAIYANIDRFNFSENVVSLENRPILDRWILSELHTLIGLVTAAYEQYEPTKASRLIQVFVGEKLSNWYVRLCRRRFWKGEYDKNKISAYQTLYECLITVSKLASCIAPFFMDKLFCDLNFCTKKEESESVHLSFFPKVNNSFINTKLETTMTTIRSICSLALSLRKKENIRVRQPLESIIVQINSGASESDVLELKSFILSELNIKKLIFSSNSGEVVSRRLKVNFPVLGKKHGKHIKKIVQIITKLNQDDVNKFENEGCLQISVNNNVILLEKEDLIITSEDLPGFLTANNDKILVALNTSISASLYKEGLAREFINKVQSLRKDHSLIVTSKIDLVVFAEGDFKDAIEEHRSHICREVLASSIGLVKEPPKNNAVFEFNNYKLYIAFDVII